MAAVKWIKIVTDIFDDEKMLLIESLPAADSIIVIWFKLLCLAGKNNNSGVFIFNDRIPYTDEMLATIFRRELHTVRLALRTFEDFGMIEVIDDVITIPNWDKHQTLDAYERQKEKDRLKKREQRRKQKMLIATSNSDMSGDVSGDKSADSTRDVPALEEDKEEEIDKERDIDITSTNVDVCSDDSPEPTTEHRKPVPYEQIRKLYNDICHSFPACRVLSENRKKAIKARFAAGYTVEDFQTLFQKAEDSSFLKGQNNRNWTATLDWLIKDGNIAKVLDCNYDDHGRGSGTTTPQRQDDLDFIPD